MEGTKQVIVIRKDLNMRKGKIAAQSSHATMSFLTKRIESMFWAIFGYEQESTIAFESRLGDKFTIDELQHWFGNSFRKICVYVNSEEELLEIHKKAEEAGLVSHLITDNGATEFNGVPTKTCLGLGPHWDSKFVNITDHLPLL